MNEFLRTLAWVANGLWRPLIGVGLGALLPWMVFCFLLWLALTPGVWLPPGIPWDPVWGFLGIVCVAVGLYFYEKQTRHYDRFLRRLMTIWSPAQDDRMAAKERDIQLIGEHAFMALKWLLFIFYVLPLFFSIWVLFPAIFFKVVLEVDEPLGSWLFWTVALTGFVALSAWFLWYTQGLTRIRFYKRDPRF